MKRAHAGDKLRVVLESSDDEAHCVDGVFEQTSDGKAVGRWSANVLERDGVLGFFEECDAVSAELQEVGCTFCEDDGSLRLQALKKAGVDYGGLCYVKNVTLDGDVSTAERAECIRLLLDSDHLDWTLAVYIPESRGRPEGETVLEAWQRDAESFFRAGFVQAVDVKEYHVVPFLYATHAMLTGPLRAPDAMQVEGRTPSLVGEPTALDEQLRRVMLDQVNLPKVKELVAQGASITRSGALHICCFNYATHAGLIRPLLELCPEAINATDTQNNTPLMVAAAVPCSQAQVQCLRELLELGADKYLKNPAGDTALDILRQGFQGLADFRAAFGMEENEADRQNKIEAEQVLK